MIPAPTDVVEFDSLPGEEIEFGIGDPRWVMRTQADLYSDITTAIIREYSTNAYDAHVMAGNPDPIEVTLPSLMNDNMFVVRDNGVGISKDLFRDIYTQFGNSDKRGSNTTNGMLGYGSKSGVAYTTQFQVTSVRDGMKIEGVIKRKPDWSIALKIVSHQRTDEPNGTIVRIPVHNPDEFRHKAMEFYKFWLPGRVLVDGVEPEHKVGRKIADNLYASLSWNTSYVVMGNVPYRINNPSALFTNTKMNFVNFVAYVDSIPMKDGAQAVEFTPSREDLKYTDRTKDTLQGVINDFERNILATAQKEITKAADHAEAFLAYNRWTNSLGRQMFSTLEYKGDKFESNFDLVGHRYSLTSSYNAMQRISQWNVEASPKTLYVTEFGINPSSSVKARAKKYAKAKGLEVSYIVFTAKPASSIVSPWIKRDKMVTWETLKEAVPTIPKVRQPGNYYNPNEGRVSGSWDYITVNGRETEQPLPAKGDIFYLSVQEDKRLNTVAILGNLPEKYRDAIVLIVPGNRKAKLLRENPNVKPFFDFARSQVVKDGASLLSADAKRLMAIDPFTRKWVNALDTAKVDDPEIAKLHSLVKDEPDLMATYTRNLSLARTVSMWYTVQEYHAGESTNYVGETYPLLASVSAYSLHEHVYTYMNAAYAAESE